MQNSNTIAKSLRIYGVVQGVGMRPTVDRHAKSCGITGTVKNRGSFVDIVAEGTSEEIGRFAELIRNEPPERAFIIKIEISSEPLYEGRRCTDFSIAESQKEESSIFIPPDIAVCDECAAELYDRTSRRYLHPFINCTSCGPRLTILKGLPYDRKRTAMSGFSMCESCREEYFDIKSRRYDAQPVCCNSCGPKVYIIGSDLTGADAVRAARKAIIAGEIIAVKGIGGFHLCCSAESDTAVGLLRTKKHRPSKPFAVMMRDLDTVKKNACLSKEAEKLLAGHQKPIVLLRRKKLSVLSPLVAPDNPFVGVMLPYAPVQLLLFRSDDELDEKMPSCLVMTSGNTSGASICIDDNEAVTELSGIASLMLSNDRDILTRADDSVTDFFDGMPYMIRRSRGFAPLPVMPEGDFSGNVLALGGELKNTFCIGRGGLFYPSSYIGDLSEVRSIKALDTTVRRYETLLHSRPETIVCDMHPDYNSTALAEKLAEEYAVPCIKVQHHFAHVLSCMAENSFPAEKKCIGVCFDGTGYGSDDTIWGGEILLVGFSGFERLSHITPFIQAGGDASSREGWRIAAAMLESLKNSGKTDLPDAVSDLRLCSEEELYAVRFMLSSGTNAVKSTSAGRLFDAVSAVLRLKRESTFEGEAANALMFSAMRYEERLSPERAMDEAAERFSSLNENNTGLCTDRLFSDIVQMSVERQDREKTAYYFHYALSRQIASEIIKMRGSTGADTVAFSGGCFQNRLLLRLSIDAVRPLGMKVITHSMIPPNDGGIALGQAAFAAYKK